MASTQNPTNTSIVSISGNSPNTKTNQGKFNVIPISEISGLVTNMAKYAIENFKETALLSMLLSPVIPPIFGYIHRTINSYLWSYLQFKSGQKEYKAILFYLSEILQGQVQENKNNYFHSLAISDQFTTYNHNPSDLEKQREKILFIPGHGIHKIYYNGNTIYVNIISTRDGNITYGEIELSIRFRKINVLKDFAKFVQEAYFKKFYNSTMIYKPDLLGGYWNQKVMKRKRALETVVLQDGIMNSLIEDIKHFKNEKTKEFYTKFGYSYSRSYLLHGPPGTGKSSTIRAIASYFDLDIYSLNLANKELTDSSMEELFATLPSGSLLLLEDIDAVVSRRDESDEVDDARSTSSDCPVSMTSLLNSLDGVESNEDRIIFMTTNRYDLLRKEKRLIRPGRVDKIFEIKNADTKQVESIFDSLFDFLSEKSISNNFGKKFAEKLSEIGSFSPSTIKEYLLPYAIEQNTQGAIDNIDSINQNR